MNLACFCHSLGAIWHCIPYTLKKKTKLKMALCICFHLEDKNSSSWTEKFFMLYGYRQERQWSISYYVQCLFVYWKLLLSLSGNFAGNNRVKMLYYTNYILLAQCFKITCTTEDFQLIHIGNWRLVWMKQLMVTAILMGTGLM